MRAELSSFPDGVYSFEDVLENDGIEAVPYTVAIDLHIQGDEVVADYSRSSRQAKGPINATLGVATGAVYNGLLHVTDAIYPEKFRLLPADPGGVTAGQGDECRLSGTLWSPATPRRIRDLPTS